MHYPLFARVGEAAWPRYEAEHRRRITPLVLPVMTANVALGVALVLRDPSALAWVNVLLAAGVFAATGGVYGPLHGRLEAAHDRRLIARLVRLNRLRTAAWTAQLAVAIALFG